MSDAHAVTAGLRSCLGQPSHTLLLETAAALAPDAQSSLAGFDVAMDVAELCNVTFVRTGTNNRISSETCNGSDRGVSH